MGIDAEFWAVSRGEYNADTEHIRSTQAKDYYSCPSIYEARYVTGRMPPKQQSHEMLLGVCFHSLQLEGGIVWSVARQCEAAYASGKRKGEQCTNTGIGTLNGDWYCGQHAKGVELIKPANLITAEEEEGLHEASRRLNDNQEADELLDDKHDAEHAMRCTDVVYGLKLKALLDVYRHDGQIVDLKYTSEFNAESLWRRIEKLGWGFSLAFYERVRNHVLSAQSGELSNHASPWKLIVVESVPPYRNCVFAIDRGYQDICRTRVRRTLGEMQESIRSGKYETRQLNPAMPQWVGYVDEDKKSHE